MTRLKEKDLVGVITPAGPLPDRYSHLHEYILKELRDKGFSVVDLSNKSFDPVREADVIASAISNKEISALLPVCGNPIIHETVKELSKIDVDQRGVLVCGYSEITALLIHLHNRSVGSLYTGPHLNFLNEKSSNKENGFSIYSFWNMLKGGSLGSKFVKKRHENHCYYREDRGFIKNIYTRSKELLPQKLIDLTYYTDNSQDFEGKTVCFTLEVLLEMLNYEDKIDFRGKVVFFDTLNKSPEEVVELFNQLCLRTNVEKANAIIFNACFRTDNKDRIILNDRSVNDMCRHIKEKTGSPVVHGFPYGHCRYKLTLPIGETIRYMHDDEIFQIDLG